MPLHHHIARPISVHMHKPTASTLHKLSFFLAVIFVIILAALVNAELSFLLGASKLLIFAIILPAAVAIFLLIFFINYRKKFYRDYYKLKRKFAVKYEHSFKHN